MKIRKKLKLKRKTKEVKPKKIFLEKTQKKQLFEYQLLSRLQRDCEYYLGWGDREKKHLWAKDEKKQIKKMLEIYKTLKIKPRWLGRKKILNYSKKMLNEF